MGNELLIGIAAVIILFAFAGVIGIIFFSSAGERGTVRPASGRIEREERPIMRVRAVSVTGEMTLDISQGDDTMLAVSGDDDILPRVRTRVEDGVLLVDYDEAWTYNRLQPTQPLMVMVMLPEVESITLNGACRCMVGALQTREFSLHMDGTCTAKIDDLQAESMALTMAGRCEATLAGHVRQQTLNISGMAQVHGERLESAAAAITIDGMSQATLWATSTLNVTMGGSPRLQYYGDPALNEDEKAGDGVILRLGDAP